jgi:hypothetical protein
VTSSELQRIAGILSNSAWTRLWLNWGDRRSGPVTMAIQCIDPTGRPQRIGEAEARGFTGDLRYVYTIPRTSEDGSPYLAKLL